MYKDPIYLLDEVFDKLKTIDLKKEYKNYKNLRKRIKRFPSLVRKFNSMSFRDESQLMDAYNRLRNEAHEIDQEFSSLFTVFRNLKNYGENVNYNLNMEYNAFKGHKSSVDTAYKDWKLRFEEHRNKRMEK